MDMTSSSSSASYFCQGPDELYNRLESLVSSEEGLLQTWCGDGEETNNDITDHDDHADGPVPPLTTGNKAARTKKTKKKQPPHVAPQHFMEAIQQQYFLNSKRCSSLLDDEDEEEAGDYESTAMHETDSMDTSMNSHTKFKIVSSSGALVDNYNNYTSRRRSLPPMIPNRTNTTTASDVPSPNRPAVDKEGPVPTVPLHLQNLILQEEIMEELQSYLPLSKKGESFWLLYSLTRDGASLDLLLNKVQDAETTILAVETLDGEVFGAFCTQAWKKSHDYYGSGQSFLWRKTNTRNHSSQEEQEHHLPVQVFSFAYTNYNIQLLTQQNLIVGGSGGMTEYDKECNHLQSNNMDSSSTSIHSTSSSNFNNNEGECGFGLWLEHDLLQGSSSPCSTFSSPSLSVIHADGSAFEIANVEVWALTPCINLEQAKKTMDNKRFLAGHYPNPVKQSWMHAPSPDAVSVRRRRREQRQRNSTGGGGAVGTTNDNYDDEDDDDEQVSLFGTSTDVPLARAREAVVRSNSVNDAVTTSVTSG